MISRGIDTVVFDLHEQIQRLERFIHGVSIGKDSIIFGDGSQKRSYNFAKDTARGAADSIVSNKTDNKVMNIGNSSEPIALIDLPNKVIKLAGKERFLEVLVKNTFDNTDRDEKREIYQRYCDTSLAEKLINYKSKVTLDEGMKEILDIGTFQSTWVSSEKEYLID